MFFVYIIECNDTSYYVGLSEDLNGRIKAHNNGQGSDYTKNRRPVRLAYSEEITNRKEAEVREIEIKKLSKKNKEHLIKYGKGVKLSRATDKS